MHTFTYASELDPLLELSLPADWIVAVVLEPGQLLSESDIPEDQLFGQLFSGSNEEVGATRLQFQYVRGIDLDRETLSRDGQISVSYDVETGQYELSSRQSETTVQTADEAIDWIDDQLIAVEPVTDTSQILIDLAEDIHGLGQAGVQELVDTFETLDAIRAADVEVLADVPYVNEEHAKSLQIALDDIDSLDETDPTPLELELQSLDGPLLLDLQEGPVSGELVPSGASKPKYKFEGFGDIPQERDDGVTTDG
jgi:hypothetical protein